jgi:hypothetical protein
VLCELGQVAALSGTTESWCWCGVLGLFLACLLCCPTLGQALGDCNLCTLPCSQGDFAQTVGGRKHVNIKVFCFFF